MFEDRIRDEIQSSASICFGEHVKTADVKIEKPTERKFGDFTSNISFQLAGKLKQSPSVIAEKLATDLEKSGVFEKVEAVSGFLNFTLTKERYTKILEGILNRGKKYADSNILSGKKVQVEFISANPTGPLTLANGRGGFSGDALSNVLAKAGAKVEREYYVNDGGNQVKVLGDSILIAAGLLKKDDDYYKGEYINDWASSHKEEINKHKDSPFNLGQLAAKNILNDYIKPSVEKMEVDFDVWFSENEMIKKGTVEKVLAGLDKYKMTKIADGAKWFSATKFGENQDYVLIKTDGEKTYFANDIAYLYDKLYNRKFDKVIDIWGADHHGHVGRMLAAEKALGCEGHLEIIISQMVRLIKKGKEYKMSKRLGSYVTMDDLLTLIGSGKSSLSGDNDTRDASDVARFFFLSRSFNTHMDFDLDLAKERSDKNPVFYVKYAYARISGILGKTAKDSKIKKPNLALLSHETELELIDKLSELPALVEGMVSMGDYPVHLLTSYAIEVAKRFHSFYDKCRVIDEENPELTVARLELVRAAKNVLGIVGEDLIGINMPEKM